MLTDIASTSQRLASASPKDGCIRPPTCSNKGLRVVTSLVTAERAWVSFFCRECSFLRMRRLFFLSGASGSFCIFFIHALFNFNFLFLSITKHQLFVVVEEKHRIIF